MAQAGDQGEPGCGEKLPTSARSGFGTCQILGFVSTLVTLSPQQVTSEAAWKEKVIQHSPPPRQREEER